jgi:hypothetical protein
VKRPRAVFDPGNPRTIGFFCPGNDRSTTPALGINGRILWFWSLFHLLQW